MFSVLGRVEMGEMYTCGDLDLTFSGSIPYVVWMIITIIKIVVPILLIIFGMIDMAKAVMAQKEDEIKKGQQTLIKRTIAAVIVFFVVFLAQMLIRFLASGNEDTGDSVLQCFECFVNGSTKDSATQGSGCVKDAGTTAPGFTT